MTLNKSCVVLFLCLQIRAYSQTSDVESTGPPTLTFQELITAAEVDPPPPELQRKMDTLFNTPFINNSGTSNDSPENGRDDRVLRVAEWNIYRTTQDADVKLAFANDPAFFEKASKNPRLSEVQRTALKEQIRTLTQTDVVILNEVDDGVARQHYHNVPQELATVLHMNYAFAVEFLELNRIYMGAKKMDVANPAGTGGQNNFGLDPTRYLGLEGTALLSRYPIQSARIVHLPEVYDWYHAEIRALSDLEKVRRWTAQRVFEERVKRQVRRGGRLALIVELKVPNAPGGVLTVVCPHLEDNCSPKARRRQMDYLLTQIRDLKGPVLVGGDLNTLGHDGRPLTAQSILHRWLLNYRFWLKEVGYFFLPVPGAGEVFRVANYVKNLYDPTALSVPLILDNPERKLFTDTRAFKFEDGAKLNFAGYPRLSYKHHGHTLADSSQRQWKGFTPSFTFEKTYGGLAGEFKLDWMFVKHNADQPSYSLTPSFGRTLTLVNNATVPRISPHSPTELEMTFDFAASTQHGSNNASHR
jgi:endonuclease/exonuclease/phosphatase family metal-dependent hydrolase